MCIHAFDIKTVVKSNINKLNKKLILLFKNFVLTKIYIYLRAVNRFNFIKFTFESIQ